MIFLEVDPNVVKPGWTPLIITILLAAAIALLMLSMRRQMRKVRVPHRDEVGGAEAVGPTPAADRPSEEPRTTEDPGAAADAPDQPDGKPADRPTADHAPRPGS
ncbi:hypothetical protein [Microlunatus soli]|uniref:Uncharacterized protein n=1 Tax=Microlunatus soli TaxID=630515 RepID=A0A1H1QNP2_9ACTN|nr:hypothetical protein [Microlunatus soli]SDS25035.1 hypothetical protein SAMN04489812_1332 [Microlunatus soli]